MARLPRGARRLLGVALLLLGVVAAVLGTVWARFDPAIFKPMIAAEVKRNLGRDITIGGLHLHFLPDPALIADDVTLANLPGGSRPAMMSVHRLRADISLGALLFGAVDVTKVDLQQPDIVLETVKGRPNWRFDAMPDASASNESSGAPSSPAPRSRVGIEFQRLVMTDAQITWRDGPGGQAVKFVLPDWNARIDSSTHMLSAGGIWRAHTESGDASGTARLNTGPIQGTAMPWPIGLQFSADMSAIIPGLQLDTAQITMNAGQPARLDGRARYRNTSLGLAGTVGVLPVMDGNAPVAFDLTSRANGASLSLRGELMHPAALAGLTAATTGQVPDLSVLSSLADHPLPPLRNIALGAAVSDAGGLRHGVSVSDLHLTSAAGDLAGRGQVIFGQRPDVRAVLASEHLNVDMLRGLLPPTEPASPNPGPAPASTTAPALTKPAHGSAMLVPDTAVPLDWMRRANADLQLGVGTLRWDGGDYHNFTGRMLLKDGRLRLDPFAGYTPAGFVGLGLLLDANQETPVAQMLLRAPALNLGGVLGWFGLPPQAEGTVALDAELHAVGRSPRAMFGTLSGHVGAWLAGGELGADAMRAIANKTIGAAGLPNMPEFERATPLRCMAVRINAANGQADVPVLMLDTPVLRLTGGGKLNLADETMALKLQPALWLNAGGVELDARADGPWRNPKLAFGQKKSDTPLDMMMALMPHGAQPMTDCPSAIALARGGMPVPRPASPPAPPQTGPQVEPQAAPAPP